MFPGEISPAEKHFSGEGEKIGARVEKKILLLPRAFLPANKDATKYLLTSTVRGLWNSDEYLKKGPFSVPKQTTYGLGVYNCRQSRL